MIRERDRPEIEDAMIVSKAGLKEAIIGVLLETFSEGESVVLSERSALRIAEDIVWRGTQGRQREDTR